MGIWRLRNNFPMEQSAGDLLLYLANETFVATLVSIAYKAGDEQKAKDYFEKKNSLKNSRTKTNIENDVFYSVRSRDFMKDYINMHQSLRMPDQ